MPKKENPPNILRRAVATKAPLRVQFLLTCFGGRGEEQEASALLSRKGGGRSLKRVSKSLTFSVMMARLTPITSEKFTFIGYSLWKKLIWVAK